MYIVTDRLVIRDFCTSDVNDLHEILGDSETMKYCEPPYRYEQTQNFLQDFCITKHGAFAAVCKENVKVIGYILFKSLEASVYEIGWIFNKKYWRKGYAYEACSELIAYGFRELHIHKVVAETVDCRRSVPLMEKLGMRREGVQKSQAKDSFGNQADLYLYAISQNDV